MKELNIVIGANYGDEGKGLTTANVTKPDGIVVLGNGGAQRGHTAETELARHVFHHFGSASLAGAATYTSEDFILNPAHFVVEVKELKFIPKLYLNMNCRVTTIYDMLANAIRSELNGNHDSTGFGVWETINRYEASDKWYYIKDYANANKYEREEELNRIRHYYLAQDWIKKSNSKLLAYFHNNAVNERFLNDLAFFLDSTAGFVDYDYILNNFNNITIECAQGLALDTDVDIEKGTPTHTGSQNLLPWLKLINSDTQVNRYYVSRTYITRHGDGELPDYDPNMFFEDKTNIPNEFQGSIRFAPMSDTNKKALCNRITKDIDITKNYQINNYIVLTHTNEIDLDDNFLYDIANITAIKKSDNTITIF